MFYNYDTYSSAGFFWIADGVSMLGDDGVHELEPSIFDDGCTGIAEGSVWDVWSGTYLVTQEPRFAEFSEYIEHPAYSGVA